MKVLFLCVANSSRSQMAEGLAKNIFPPMVDVQSAGSQPTMINPFAQIVMGEIGIDISGQRAKSCSQLPEDYIAEADFIITLCAEEICPTVPGCKARRFHWPLPDPGKSGTSDLVSLEKFRDVREQLEDRLLLFCQGYLQPHLAARRNTDDQIDLKRF